MQEFDFLCQKAEDLFNTGKDDEAATLAGQLICQDPTNARPYYTLGCIFTKHMNDGAALACLQKCVDINPQVPIAWVSLANVLKRSAHIEAARMCYQRAVELDPENYYAWGGYAGSYVNRGDPERGIEHARKAIRLAKKAITDPERMDFLTNCRNSLALCLLESGKWEEGWDEYKNRAKTDLFHVRDYDDLPHWEGQKVKTLAIHAEQGLGDEILFATCIPDAMKRAERVIFECSPRLIPLFKRSLGIECFGTHDELMASGIKIDAWERLGDLPRYFRKRPEDCPGTAYLKTDPVKVASARARLEALGPGPYVGIAWKGGSKQTHEELRRAPVELWQRLVKETPGTKISLQYGKDAHRQAEVLGVTHWQAMIDDLDEFAALTEACDVVVTVCQTAVHIAGAIGKRAIVLTPKAPAWRYGLTGEQMCWYKSVELVRQTGDTWVPVFQEAIRRVSAVQPARTSTLDGAEPMRQLGRSETELYGQQLTALQQAAAD